MVKKDDLLKFVLSTERREKALKKLSELKIAHPAKVAKILRISRATSQRAFNELEEKKLIECISPEKSTWKRYKISKLGKKISSELYR